MDISAPSARPCRSSELEFPASTWAVTRSIHLGGRRGVGFAPNDLAGLAAAGLRAAPIHAARPFDASAGSRRDGSRCLLSAGERRLIERVGASLARLRPEVPRLFRLERRREADLDGRAFPRRIARGRFPRRRVRRPLAGFRGLELPAGRGRVVQGGVAGTGEPGRREKDDEQQNGARHASTITDRRRDGNRRRDTAGAAQAFRAPETQSRFAFSHRSSGA